MLTPARPRRARRWRVRPLAALLAALLAAPAAAVGSASAAQADAVRQQELWVLNAMDVAGAWQHTRGSGVTVALIDSGVNGQVSDLAGSVVTGRDYSGVNTAPTNANWGVHGTWMASLIAGHGHDVGGSSGIMGVAPAARILSIRAVTDQGDPAYRRYQHESASRVQTHLADAIKYATSKRVSVISMSLGYQGASRPVRAAISAALAQGIVVVASSGNSGGAATGHPGNAPYSFPADYPGVLGVGAVRQGGLPAGFSSDNLSVQVAAPGVRVPAQGRDGQYWLVSGTSPACALTAGVAALIKSVYPALAPALVVQAITSSTSNKPPGGYDQEVGFGTVDASAALRMAGRLARDGSTGRGQVAAAQFGGGPGAVPAVPVAPRTRQQFVVDTVIALACLVVVLVLAFRLIVTRRPAVAGAARGWEPGGIGSRAERPAPRGWAGSGEPGPGGPRSGAGPRGSGMPGAAGPGAPGGNGGWPDAGGTGYGRSAGYWASGGYKPPATPRQDPPAIQRDPPDPPAIRPDQGYGLQAGFQPPAAPAPSADYGAPGNYRRPAGATPPAGFEPLADPGPPAESRGAAGYQHPAGTGVPADQGVPGYGATRGYDRPAGSGRSPGPGMPGGHPGPADSGRSVDPKLPGGYPDPAGSPRSAEYRASGDYQHLTAPGPVWPGSVPPGPAAGNGSRPGHGAPPVPGPPGDPGAADGKPAGYRPPAQPRPPARRASHIPGRPGDAALPGLLGTPAGRPADADTRPLPSYPEPADRHASERDKRPAADDDTWPSSSAW